MKSQRKFNWKILTSSHRVFVHVFQSSNPIRIVVIFCIQTGVFALLMRNLSIEVRNVCKTISLLIRLSHFSIWIFIFNRSSVGSFLTFRMRSSPNSSNNNSFWSNRMRKNRIHMFSMVTKQCENRKTHWILMLTMNNNQLESKWKKHQNKNE